MTNHVPTLETSKKLKAAGFLQETQHCWVDMGEHWIVAHHPAWTKGDISAPLLTELITEIEKEGLSRAGWLEYLTYYKVHDGNLAEELSQLYIDNKGENESSPS